MLSQQHAHRLSGFEVLGAQRQDAVAVGAGIGGEVSGALPADKADGRSVEGA